MQSACFWISGCTSKLCFSTVTPSGAAFGRQAELVHPGVERILVAEEPDAERLALEVGFGLDRPVLRADQLHAGLLEGLGDVDQRHALFAGGERAAHPVDDHVGAAAGDHLLGRDVGAARLDLDVEAFLLVEALVLGDVVAGELRLRDPFQLQRHLVGGQRLECGKRHRAGQHRNHQFFHFLTLWS